MPIEESMPEASKSEAPALRFLVVDDEPLVREMLNDILIDLNYDVVGQANDGASAIEKAAQLKPDVICLDINMPEVSGLDALASIKTSNKDIVVIMVTANNDTSTVQQAIRTGADGYILKPFNAQQIVKAVDRALAKHKRL
ncbi:response regulator [Marinospirillum insulare]|uniref:Response regulator n=1 Tax=Marinospirillum insulare TaxID=217169 RepID=A0ABQ5ZXY6_9GAMM|nr:response regulator [Marinospirillum insulare]GLR65061.1 response regulator [Marinospirillum insulare]